MNTDQAVITDYPFNGRFTSLVDIKKCLNQHVPIPHYISVYMSDSRHLWLVTEPFTYQISKIWSTAPHKLPAAKSPHPFLSLLIHGKANITWKVISVNEKRKQNTIANIIITFLRESNILHHNKWNDFVLHSITVSLSNNLFHQHRKRMSIMSEKLTKKVICWRLAE